MKSTKFFRIFLITCTLSALLLSGLLVGCGRGNNDTPEPTATAIPLASTPEPAEADPVTTGDQDILTILANPSHFGEHSVETVRTAIDAADLTEKLQTTGPFTLFAPTDAAFNALPSDQLDALLADPEILLADVLFHHLLDQELTSSSMPELEIFTSILGDDIMIANEGGTIQINEAATVIIADIEASNGVVHVIDQVILPPELGAE
ncbi:MAG: fasciclin domain-containing protein [Chloroflexota bacterium]